MKKRKFSINNKKILHGMSEISGQGSYSVMGLRRLGEDATMVVWRRNPFGYPVNIDLGLDKDIRENPWLLPAYILKMGFFAIKAFFTYDIFHFHFGNSLIRRGLDLFWLHLFHKRTIMEYHGDDIRYCYERTKPKYYPFDEFKKVDKRRMRTNNRVLRYVETIVTHDEELREHIPRKDIYITPLRVNINKFKPVYPKEDKDRVVIVHAPSSYVGKGSKYIIEAVNNLKAEYDIEFILVENKTREEAIKIYQRADIIVDQLFAQTYGVFAIEGMLLGKPVVGYISEEIRKTFPESMPIVSATIETIESVLEELVKDGSRRHKLGIAGRKYAEEYHDHRKIAQVQMDIYERRIKPMSTLESFEYAKSKEVK